MSFRSGLPRGLGRWTGWLRRHTRPVFWNRLRHGTISWRGIRGYVHTGVNLNHSRRRRWPRCRNSGRRRSDGLVHSGEIVRLPCVLLQIGLTGGK